MSTPLDLLEAAVSSHPSPTEDTAFACQLSYALEYPGSKYRPSDWIPTICQFSRRIRMLRNAWITLDDPRRRACSRPPPPPILLIFAYEISIQIEFEPLTANSASLIFTVTDYTVFSQIFSESILHIVCHNRDDWVNVYQNDDNYSASDAILSFSLCFRAVQSWYLVISTSSTVSVVPPNTIMIWSISTSASRMCGNSCSPRLAVPWKDAISFHSAAGYSLVAVTILIDTHLGTRA